VCAHLQTPPLIHEENILWLLNLTSCFEEEGETEPVVFW
jgi:hypothetical protein